MQIWTYFDGKWRVWRKFWQNSGPSQKHWSKWTFRPTRHYYWWTNFGGVTTDQNYCDRKFWWTDRSSIHILRKFVMGWESVSVHFDRNFDENYYNVWFLSYPIFSVKIMTIPVKIEFDKLTNYINAKFKLIYHCLKFYYKITKFRNKLQTFGYEIATF